MFNQIKSELYKSNKLGTYILNLIIVIGVFFVAFLVKKSGEPMGEGTIFNIANMGIGGVTLFLLAYVPYFFEDNKYCTLKNVATSNISRTKIYVGKFIAQIILCVISAVIGLLAFFIAINIFGIGGPNQGEAMITLIKKVMIATPVYIGCLALFDMVIIAFKKEGLALFICFVVNQGLHTAIMLGNYYIGGVFTTISEYALTVPLVNLSNHIEITTEAINKCLIGGFSNTAIFLLIGLLIFNKLEVK